MNILQLTEKLTEIRSFVVIVNKVSSHHNISSDVSNRAKSISNEIHEASLNNWFDDDDSFLKFSKVLDKIYVLVKKDSEYFQSILDAANK